MKRITILTTLTALLALWTIAVFGAVPQLINFQGVLKDGSGNPVANGVYTVRFRIYDDSTAGSILWEETVPVATTSGLFSVRMGDGTALPNNLFSTGSNRFVGIKVNLDPELAPRTRLISVPYTVQALRSDSAVTATVSLDLTCSGCVSGSEVDATQVQLRVTGTAPGGQYITGINQNGTVVTASDQVGAASGWTDDGAAVRLTTGADKVGIGTTTPTKKLEVAGGIKGDTIFSNILSSNSPLSLQAPVGSTRMYIDDATGYVGIGTSAPVYKLDVQTDGNAIRGIGGGGGGFTGVEGEGYYGVYATGSQTGVYGTGFTNGGRFTGTGGGSYGVLASGGNTGVSASGGTRGVFGSSNSGSGVDGSSSSGYGVNGTSSSNYGVHGYSSSSYGVAGEGAAGVLGIGSPAAGVFIGNVSVFGNLSKTTGSFKIDHPLDPANKYLYHSFVESPDMMNIYNGNVVTDAKGNSIVTLPDWFGTLNKDFRYQLTVIGQFAQAIVSKEIADNQFSIQSDKPNVKVSWQVTGIRQDAYANAHRIQVEEDKPVAERGKYLHPKELGMPETLGMNYEMTQKMEAERKLQEEQRTKMEQERLRMDEKAKENQPNK